MSLYDEDWTCGEDLTCDEGLMLAAYILSLMADANGGTEPATIWQYRRVARRFGVKIKFVPVGGGAGGFARHRPGRGGVIYVSRTRAAGQLRREVLHELAEVATYWDGVPPWVCSIARHDIARMIERAA